MKIYYHCLMRPRQTPLRPRCPFSFSALIDINSNYVAARCVFAKSLGFHLLYELLHAFAIYCSRTNSRRRQRRRNQALFPTADLLMVDARVHGDRSFVSENVILQTTIADRNGGVRRYSPAPECRRSDGIKRCGVYSCVANTRWHPRIQ